MARPYLNRRDLSVQITDGFARRVQLLSAAAAQPSRASGFEIENPSNEK